MRGAEMRKQIVLTVSSKNDMPLLTVHPIVSKIQCIAVYDLAAIRMHVIGLRPPVSTPQTAQRKALLTHEKIDVGK